MASPPITIRHDGHVAHVVLDRPRAMNAITVALARALREAIVDLSDEARVVVIRGAGGNFSVGGDYKELTRLREDGRDAMRELFGAFAAACSAIATAPIPIVAAVEGYAVAGGFELLQVCDVVIVRDDAQLGDNHINFAMLPGGGGSQRLARIVGRQRAMAHILTGERITGAQAVAWGLAHRATSEDEFEATVDAVADELAGKDRLTLARAKALVNDGLSMALSAGLALESRAVLDHLSRDGAMDRFVGARR
jgi:enoyl-CoA hydratase/carnithine racemase